MRVKLNWISVIYLENSNSRLTQHWYIELFHNLVIEQFAFSFVLIMKKSFFIFLFFLFFFRVPGNTRSAPNIYILVVVLCIKLLVLHVVAKGLNKK